MCVICVSFMSWSGGMWYGRWAVVWGVIKGEGDGDGELRLNG